MNYSNWGRSGPYDSESVGGSYSRTQSGGAAQTGMPDFLRKYLSGGAGGPTDLNKYAVFNTPGYTAMNGGGNTAQLQWESNDRAQRGALAPYALQADTQKEIAAMQIAAKMADNDLTRESWAWRDQQRRKAAEDALRGQRYNAYLQWGF